MIHEGLMKRFFHNDVDHNKNPTIRKTVDVKVKRATGGVAALRKDVNGTSVTVTHLLVIISRMVRNGVGMLNFVAFTASDALDVCFACSGGMTTGFYKIHGSMSMMARNALFCFKFTDDGCHCAGSAHAVLTGVSTTATNASWQERNRPVNGEESSQRLSFTLGSWIPSGDIEVTTVRHQHTFQEGIAD